MSDVDLVLPCLNEAGALPWVLSRVPGLLVLHDLVLHHARAAQFLEPQAVRA